MLPAPLSIVIPSQRRTDLLRTCLASVVRHASALTEIIVVDDGSIGAAISAVAGSFAEVRVIRLPRCRGFCVAANIGCLAATAPIVELLNDDTEVTANWAQAALTAFADPQVAAVAPLVLFPSQPGEPSRIDSAGDRYYLGGIAGKRGHGELLQARYLEPCRVFGASASSAFYRRDALLHVGAFPESFGAYFEDVDLAFRLHRAGYHIRYEPQARVVHHGSSSYGKRGRQLLVKQSRNEELVFWRNLTGGVLWHALPRHMLVLLAKAWRRWQEGNLIPYLCGRLSVLGELAELRRHHRWLLKLQPSVDLDAWQIERHWTFNAAAKKPHQPDR